jgi:hypothetical protein
LIAVPTLAAKVTRSMASTGRSAIGSTLLN